MKLVFALRALSGRAAEKFITYSNYSPTPLSLKQLTAFGQKASVTQSFKFLRHELPIRLSNIMQEIHLLPENMFKTPSVNLVLGWYEQSFVELIEFEKKDVTDDKVKDLFTDTIAKIRDRHSNVVETMAQGVMEMKERYGTDLGTENQLQYFLDRFYMSRISIRMLINQHVILFGPELNNDRRYVGSIDTNCNVVHVIEDAYSNAKYLCQHYYMSSPDMELEIVNPNEDGKVQIIYVPSHLYHIAFEIMKNSLRAVVEDRPSDVDFPPIKVLVVQGKEDVTIRISDRGSGIARSTMDHVFKYTYTTAPQGHEQPEPGAQAALAGYGYGLPLSRNYARYFNGDLWLSSTEGYGTDAYIFLKRWAADADELLPVFNKAAAQQYSKTGVPVHDWSNIQRTQL